MDTPQVDDFVIWLAAILGSITVIVTAIVSLHRWLLSSVRRDITDMHEAITDIRKEVHPNSGSSLRDAVNVIRDRQSEVLADVREVRERIDDHIEWHLDH